MSSTQIVTEVPNYLVNFLAYVSVHAVLWITVGIIAITVLAVVIGGVVAGFAVYHAVLARQFWRNLVFASDEQFRSIVAIVRRSLSSEEIAVLDKLRKKVQPTLLRVCSGPPWIDESGYYVLSNGKVCEITNLATEAGTFSNYEVVENSTRHVYNRAMNRDGTVRGEPMVCVVRKATDAEKEDFRNRWDEATYKSEHTFVTDISENEDGSYEDFDQEGEYSEAMFVEVTEIKKPRRLVPSETSQPNED